MSKGGGGVGIIIRKRPEVWDIDSTQFHEPKVVRFEFISGIQQAFRIGYYLPRTTLDHLPDLKEALNRFLGREPIVLGGL